MADLSKQLELQNAINAALRERAGIMKQSSSQMGAQSNVASQMLSTMQRANNESSSLASRNESLTASMSSYADQLSNTLEQQNKLNAAQKSGKSILGKLGSTLKSILNPLKLFTSILSGAGKIFTSFFKGITSVIGGIGKLAMAIITFPLKIFEKLVSMAQEGGGGRELRQAYEDVKQTFGTLASGPGKSVIKSFGALKKDGGNLAKTGLRLTKVFGYGTGGFAAALKYVTELAQATGDHFSLLAKVFEDSADKLLVFQKGLGISAETMGDMMHHAKVMGKDVEKYMTKFSKISVQTAKEFGLGVKDIAKGMSELTVDVENFGHLGPEAFAPIVVYARKLGLEIKNMAGVMSKFAGFSDTAKAASEMQQGFGMNIDAAKLMAAQNPAEKIDMIRKAFHASGNDLSKFNYQQRMYLSQLTEMKGKDLDAAFSAKNRGITYKELAKRTKEATKEGLSQKKVLKELSKGIRRLVEELGPKVTGFFDAFMQGFDRGVVMSGPFRKTLRNIHHGLLQMKLAGREVGRIFVETFPGMKGMLEALSEILHPKKFARFRKELGPIFKMLFKTQDFNTFFDNLKKAFDKHFGTGKGGEFIKHIKSFIKAALRIVGQGLAQMVKMWVQTFTMIGEMILNPKEFKAAMKQGGIAMKYGVSEMVVPTLEMLSGETGGKFASVWKKVFTRMWEGEDGTGGIKGYFMKKWDDLQKWWQKDGLKKFINTAGKLAMGFFKALGESLMENPLPTAAFIMMFNPMLGATVVRGVAGLFTTLFSRAVPMGMRGANFAGMMAPGMRPGGMPAGGGGMDPASMAMMGMGMMPSGMNATNTGASYRYGSGSARVDYRTARNQGMTRMQAGRRAYGQYGRRSDFMARQQGYTGARQMRGMKMRGGGVAGLALSAIPMVMKVAQGEDIGGEDIGGLVGGGIGGAIGSLLGPIGTMAGSAIGGWIGGLIGGSSARKKAEKRRKRIEEEHRKAIERQERAERKRIEAHNLEMRRQERMTREYKKQMAAMQKLRASMEAYSQATAKMVGLTQKQAKLDEELAVQNVRNHTRIGVALENATKIFREFKNTGNKLDKFQKQALLPTMVKLHSERKISNDAFEKFNDLGIIHGTAKDLKAMGRAIRKDSKFLTNIHRKNAQKMEIKLLKLKEKALKAEEKGYELKIKQLREDAIKAELDVVSDLQQKLGDTFDDLKKMTVTIGGKTVTVAAALHTMKNLKRKSDTARADVGVAEQALPAGAHENLIFRGMDMMKMLGAQAKMGGVLSPVLIKRLESMFGEDIHKRTLQDVLGALMANQDFPKLALALTDIEKKIQLGGGSDVGPGSPAFKKQEKYYWNTFDNTFGQYLGSTMNSIDPFKGVKDFGAPLDAAGAPLLKTNTKDMREYLTLLKMEKKYQQDAQYQGPPRDPETGMPYEVYGKDHWSKAGQPKYDTEGRLVLRMLTPQEERDQGAATAAKEGLAKLKKLSEQFGNVGAYGADTKETKDLATAQENALNAAEKATSAYTEIFKAFKEAGEKYGIDPAQVPAVMSALGMQVTTLDGNLVISNQSIADTADEFGKIRDRIAGERKKIGPEIRMLKMELANMQLEAAREQKKITTEGLQSLVMEMHLTAMANAKNADGTSIHSSASIQAMRRKFSRETNAGSRAAMVAAARNGTAFARGGLIMTPQILTDLNSGAITGIMGEAGPEMIVPVGPADSAGAIGFSGSGNGSQPVVVHVSLQMDKKEVGKAVATANIGTGGRPAYIQTSGVKS